MPPSHSEDDTIRNSSGQSQSEHEDQTSSQTGDAAEEDDSGDFDPFREDSDLASSRSGSDSDSDNETTHGGFPPLQPQMHSFFAPPHYGRPPTPLPPSPSLTSLLRPSRPTTPDASDDEGGASSSRRTSRFFGGGGGGGGAGTSAGITATTTRNNSNINLSSTTTTTAHTPNGPVPRQSPKVPTYEYYGFVLHVFSSLCFATYLLWSYIPSPFLHTLGIYYYPNRWWSLAIPSFIVMLLVYIYVALALYNTEILTRPLEALETIVDESAHVAVLDGKGRIRVGKRRAVVTGEHINGSGKKATVAAKGRSSKGSSGGGGGGGGHAGRNGARGSSNLSAEKRIPDWKTAWSIGTDGVMDVPLAGVCEVLYGDGADDDGDFCNAR